MVWAKFDDQFNFHPKVLTAGPLAQLLYMKAVIYCSQYLTDGFVPRAAVETLINWGEGQAVFEGDADYLKQTASKIYKIENSELANRLVFVGLWEENEKKDGYYIHDYLDWNPSGKSIKKKRKKISADRAEAGKKGGQAKAKQNASKTQAKHVANPSPEPEPEPLKTKTIVPSKNESTILAVFEHYRTYHPKRHRKPTSALTEWKQIKKRLSEPDFDLATLCRAIDGNHLSPHHNGENDRGTEYHDLALIMRDSAQVNKMLGYAENPPEKKPDKYPERVFEYDRNIR